MKSLFSTLLAISLTVAIIILVLMLLSPWMDKRFTAKCKYWLWLILAVRLLIPFQLSVPQLLPGTDTTPVPIVQIAVPDIATEPLAAVLANANQQEMINRETETSVPTNAGVSANQAAPAPVAPWYYQLSLIELAQIAWITGMIVFLFWHLGLYWHCQRQLSRWSRIYITDLTGQLCQELGSKKIPSIYISDRAPGPMMVGFFCPRIYLPAIPDNETDLYFVLKHELIHWQRKDIWYKLLLLSACAVHWFNPFVHLAFRCACRDLEMACDEAVIANADAAVRRQYSEAIFNYMKKQVYRPAQLSTYFNGGLKTMKKRFSNILSTAVKRRGRAALVVVMLVLVAVGGLFACSIQGEPNTPADNHSESNWPQDTIAALGAMDEQKLRDYITQPIADGTIEEIAEQVISQDIASYFINNITGEETGNGDYDATIVNAEIISIDLLGSYDEDTTQPLYVYYLQYRLQPDDPDKVVLAGARGLDDEGWIINSNMMNSRLLVTLTADGNYSFIGYPAFDLPLDSAIRETLYGSNAVSVMDFTMSGDNFLYTLGRQVGEYPWNDGYVEDVDITDDGTIDNTDMPGTEFSRAVISTGHDDLGQTEMVWYKVEESGMKYIYSLATTDPYVSCGFAGSHHANVGQSEDELLSGWSDVLTENSNIVYSEDDDSLCVFDKVYTYTLQFADDGGNWTWVMNYYLNEGVIAGVEMYMELY